MPITRVGGCILVGYRGLFPHIDRGDLSVLSDLCSSTAPLTALVGSGRNRDDVIRQLRHNTMCDGPVVSLLQPIISCCICGVHHIPVSGPSMRPLSW